MSSEAPRPCGTVYVVSAPSGAGKTSLVRELVAHDPMVSLSVSHTTRPKRDGEREGIDYHFVDNATFKSMESDGLFLEHAQVYGNYYGTSLDVVRTAIDSGRDVILEIDWQGAEQVRTHLPDCVGIYILPPSLNALRARLTQRGLDAADVIARRMNSVREDISHWNEFDFVIVNEHFERAVAEMQSIVSSNRLRRKAQIARYADLIDSLLATDRDEE